jgi:membrane fusion protein (multidrug efflux system)
MIDRGAALLLMVAAAAAAGCSRSAGPPSRPGVSVVGLEARRSVVSTVELTGTVEPARTARLSAQVEGEVLAVTAREGDAVRSGQAIVRIDPSRLEALLGEARADHLGVEADLEDARRVLGRDRVLLDRGGLGRERLEGSETVVKRLEAALARAEARARGLEAQLADTQVRAPFDGYVLQRSVEVGDVVRGGTPLLSVASREQHVLVHVSELDLAALAPGAEVGLAVDPGGAPVCRGRVARIRPQVDPTTRNAAVEVVSGADCGLRLLPGMLVRAAITRARRDGVVALPAESLLTRPDGSRAVFVVNGNEAHARPVTAGLEGGGWVEIVDGVAQGELAVVQGQERLQDGAKVTVAGRGPKPPAEAEPAGATD